jgi:hypothetical protein
VLIVGGEVTTPAAYTAAQLAALPQTTVTVKEGGRQVTDTGVLLETLVSDAAPAYPASLLNTKNELLRVTVTARGAGRQVMFTVGELDPGFGSHPALLALTQNGHRIAHGPELVVPGDRAPVRFLARVSQLTVGIATAAATDTAPAAGSPVVVIDGHRQVTLSAARLARLPSETLTVSFTGPGGVQVHTEIGPSLFEVLAAAGIRLGLNTWVAATGNDNYVGHGHPGRAVRRRPPVAAVTERGRDGPGPAPAGDRRRRQGRSLRLRRGGHLRRDGPGAVVPGRSAMAPPARR